jgi:hypothetical protein
VAAPDRRAADPTGKQAADASSLLTGAVAVPRDAPTTVRVGGPGSSSDVPPPEGSHQKNTT